MIPHCKSCPRTRSALAQGHLLGAMAAGLFGAGDASAVALLGSCEATAAAFLVAVDAAAAARGGAAAGGSAVFGASGSSLELASPAVEAVESSAVVICVGWQSCAHVMGMLATHYVVWAQQELCVSSTDPSGSGPCTSARRRKCDSAPRRCMAGCHHSPAAAAGVPGCHGPWQPAWLATQNRTASAPGSR